MYLSGDNINAVKCPSAFAVFNLFSALRPPVFALYIIVYTAFINVYAVFPRYLPNRR
jgi:hypothetical protein